MLGSSRRSWAGRAGSGRVAVAPSARGSRRGCYLRIMLRTKPFGEAAGPRQALSRRAPGSIALGRRRRRAGLAQASATELVVRQRREHGGIHDHGGAPAGRVEGSASRRRACVRRTAAGAGGFRRFGCMAWRRGVRSDELTLRPRPDPTRGDFAGSPANDQPGEQHRHRSEHERAPDRREDQGERGRGAGRVHEDGVVDVEVEQEDDRDAGDRRHAQRRDRRRRPAPSA